MDIDFFSDELKTLNHLKKDIQKIRENTNIQPGSLVKVIKSNLVPIGTICRVVNRKPYYDKYHRWVYDVVFLDNGLVTKVENCQLLGI